MVWLGLAFRWSQVFDATPGNLLMHERGVFQGGEFGAEATAKDSLVVRSEGGRQVRAWGAMPGGGGAAYDSTGSSTATVTAGRLAHAADRSRDEARVGDGIP